MFYNNNVFYLVSIS